MTKVKCPHCGKELSSQGLAGHIRLKHGMKAENKEDSRNSSAESQENLAESQENLAESQKLFENTQELLAESQENLTESQENLVESRENREIRELTQFEKDELQKDSRIKITQNGLSYPAGYHFFEEENNVSHGEPDDLVEEQEDKTVFHCVLIAFAVYINADNINKAFSIATDYLRRLR